MTFYPGNNIAIKVPSHEFAKTVEFYRDILCLTLIEDDGIVFDFQGKKLWIDCVNSLSQAEIWLEIRTDDVKAAKTYLSGKGVTFRDDIENLPEDFNGFWIAGPSNIIHLVN